MKFFIVLLVVIACSATELCEPEQQASSLRTESIALQGKGEDKGKGKGKANGNTVVVSTSDPLA